MRFHNGITEVILTCYVLILSLIERKNILPRGEGTQNRGPKIFFLDDEASSNHHSVGLLIP